MGRGAPQSQVAQVDLGVDLNRFRPASPRERAQIRAQLGLGPGPVILSLRAGTDLYNLDVVLDAFAVVRGRLPGATLVIVQGQAPLSWSTRRALRRFQPTGAVRVIGAVSHANMPQYMRAATVGVSIPSSDGSPNSVWEALACGVPVVLSNLPQIAPRVAGSGAARLVEPSAESVATALRDVITDHQQMGRAARAWALANFDQRDQRARIERLYAAIAQPRQPPEPRADQATRDRTTRVAALGSPS